MIAAALISEVGNAQQFLNGRQMSAWCGLVPKQHSSGGKCVLGGITKHGNKDLRTLLIHGARSLLQFYEKRDDELGKWLTTLINRRSKSKAIVALANKLARIGCKILQGGEYFNAQLAFKLA
jgi:transposase